MSCNVSLDDSLGEDSDEYTLGIDEENKLLAGDSDTDAPEKEGDNIFKSAELAEIKSYSVTSPAAVTDSNTTFTPEVTIEPPLQRKSEDFDEIKLDSPGDFQLEGGDIFGGEDLHTKGNEESSSEVQRLPKVDDKQMVPGPATFVPETPYQPSPPYHKTFEMGDSDFQYPCGPGFATTFPIKHGGPSQKKGPPLQTPEPPQLRPSHPPVMIGGPPMLFRSPPPMSIPHYQSGTPDAMDIHHSGPITTPQQLGQPLKNFVPNELKQPEVIGHQDTYPIPTITTYKKVLINPHFKGKINFEGNQLDDATERFIAQQRSVLAGYVKRNNSDRLYRHAETPPPDFLKERELLRKQEDFIEANRAGLRRRMRSPTPPFAPTERRHRSPFPAQRYCSPPRERSRFEHKDVDHEISEHKKKVYHSDEERLNVLRDKEERRQADLRQKQEDERKQREGQAEKAESPLKTTQGKTASQEPLTSDNEETLELDMALDELQEVLNSGEDELVENFRRKREEGKEKAAQKQPVLVRKSPPVNADLRAKLPSKQRQRIIFEPNNSKDQEVSPRPSREEKTALKRKNISRQNVRGEKTNKASKGSFSRRHELNDIDNRDTSAYLPKSSSTRRVTVQRSTDSSLSNAKVVRGNANEPTVIVEGNLDSPTNDFSQNDSYKIIVDNLPPGMTEVRLQTLASANCINIDINRDLSQAELSFSGQAFAHHFYKRFNNRVVAGFLLKLTLVEL